MKRCNLNQDNCLMTKRIIYLQKAAKIAPSGGWLLTCQSWVMAPSLPERRSWVSVSASPAISKLLYVIVPFVQAECFPFIPLQRHQAATTGICLIIQLKYRKKSRKVIGSAQPNKIMTTVLAMAHPHFHWLASLFNFTGKCGTSSHSPSPLTCHEICFLSMNNAYL